MNGLGGFREKGGKAYSAAQHLANCFGPGTQVSALRVSQDLSHVIISGLTGA